MDNKKPTRETKATRQAKQNADHFIDIDLGDYMKASAVNYRVNRT